MCWCDCVVHVVAGTGSKSPGRTEDRGIYLAHGLARAPLRTYHTDVVVDGGGMMTGVGQVDVMFGHGADVDLCVVLSLSWWWWCRSGSDAGLTG